MEKFRKEVIAFIKYEDHVKEHEEINKMFGVDCDNVSVEDHLNYHLEYQFATGKISEEEYNKYKN